MRVKIDRLGINGEGVFKCNDGELTGKVGFVYGALPDEILDVKIINNKKSFCQCTINSIVTESISRIEPKCPYFNNCGGCDLQHMDKSLQLQFKADKIRDTLRKIAKLNNVEINEVFSPIDFGYRNKMVFPFGIRNGRAILGMYEKNSHNIVDIDNCLLANDGINKIYRISKSFFENNNKYIKLIFEKTLKYLVIRGYNDSYLITIVMKRKIKVDDYCKYLASYFKNFGVSIIIGDSDDEILKGKYEHVCCLDKLEIQEFGIKYAIDNRGFLQINNIVKKYIYEKILNEISDNDDVIDAYSGAGLLTAIMSKKARYTAGIEINASASKSAQELAKINGLHNTEFYCDDVKNRIYECLKKYKDSVLVLDPARSGCEKDVLATIMSVNSPKKIIYLSCNVSTLARDLIMLKDKYEIKYTGVMDMFPQTKHVETLVVLERIDKKISL